MYFACIGSFLCWDITIPVDFNALVYFARRKVLQNERSSEHGRSLVLIFH